MANTLAYCNVELFTTMKSFTVETPAGFTFKKLSISTNLNMGGNFEISSKSNFDFQAEFAILSTDNPSTNILSTVVDLISLVVPRWHIGGTLGSY